MKVRIRKGRHTLLIVDIDMNTTVLDVKNEVQLITDFGVQHQELIHAGRILGNKEKLSDHNINADTILEVLIEQQIEDSEAAASNLAAKDSIEFQAKEQSRTASATLPDDDMQSMASASQNGVQDQEFIDCMKFLIQHQSNEGGAAASESITSHLAEEDSTEDQAQSPSILYNEMQSIATALNANIDCRRTILDVRNEVDWPTDFGVQHQTAESGNITSHLSKEDSTKGQEQLPWMPPIATGSQNGNVDSLVDVSLPSSEACSALNANLDLRKTLVDEKNEVNCLTDFGMQDQELIDAESLLDNEDRRSEHNLNGEILIDTLNEQQIEKDNKAAGSQNSNLDRLIDMGYPEPEACSALIASLNNFQLSFQYLTEGIPGSVLMQFLEQEDPCESPFDKYRKNPIYRQLRRAIRDRPEMIDEALQWLGDLNSNLYQTIKDNREAFLKTFKDDEKDEDDDDKESG